MELMVLILAMIVLSNIAELSAARGEIRRLKAERPASDFEEFRATD